MQFSILVQMEFLGSSEVSLLGPLADDRETPNDVARLLGRD